LANLEVDHATLATAANDVRSTRQDVDGDLKKLWNEADNLAMAWLGSGSRAFGDLMQSWGRSSAKLLRAMDDIADLLQKSGTQHQVTDEEQQEAMNKYHQIING
jgi:WXG100 family type VII secretion target